MILNQDESAMRAPLMAKLVCKRCHLVYKMIAIEGLLGPMQCKVQGVCKNCKVINILYWVRFLTEFYVSVFSVAIVATNLDGMVKKLFVTNVAIDKARETASGERGRRKSCFVGMCVWPA